VQATPVRLGSERGFLEIPKAPGQRSVARRSNPRGYGLLVLVLVAYLMPAPSVRAQIWDLADLWLACPILEGIQIAFPQQDLHIRTLPESWRPARGKAEVG